MKYKPAEARDYAQAHLKGVWAATPTPFTSSLELDEPGLRKNLRHWLVDLEIAGLFIGGKQGEYFSMSVAERKRLCDVSVEVAREYRSHGSVMLSCSDQNLDTVLELAEYAEAAGADYVVIHSPMLHFGEDIDTTVYEYYRYLSERLRLGIVMWSHADAGYLMKPRTCARIAADCPNVVAIKYSGPRAMYAELTHMSREHLIVSSSSEAEWLDNILELGWQLYLCSVPPLLYQTASDRRIQQYTELALAGHEREARRVRDSLEPVRRALAATRPPGTPHAQQKYWQDLLGQVGGPVRRPLLQLTEADRAAIRAAFDRCGLGVRSGTVPEIA
jgi:4-hydroxy-tetrahydrodipicolinate synthase